ncbi:MAG: MFS transporter [Gammaproteobacteria bacterium]|nr:MFS transporter [Gammaproteobacteria bacterium]
MNAIILLLTLAGFTVVAVMRVLDPLLPVVAAEFGVTVGATAVIVAAFALPYGLCQLVYGPLGDRVGKLRVITSTLLLTAVFIFLSGFAHSVAQLAVLRFLTAITCAATVPLTMAFIADGVDYNSRQGAIGRYMGGIILGQIMGAGIGAILVDLIGWRAIFWCFGVMNGLVAMTLKWGAKNFTLPTPTQVSLRTSLGRYVEIARDPKARDVLTAAFIEGFYLFAGVIFIGPMLHQRHGLSMVMVGVFLIFLGLGSLLYSLIVRWLVHTLGQWVMVQVGGAFMALAFIILGIAKIWWLCAPVLVMLGFGIYLMHNTLQTLATELAPGARGTAVSLFAFVIFVGQGLGALLFGWLIDYAGYALAFEVNGVALGLLGLWLRGSRSLAAH